MNNKPVAWMVDGVLFNSLGTALNISFDIEQPCIPLYTHPVKELTEDELAILIASVPIRPLYEDLMDFAKAILRKAQEK